MDPVTIAAIGALVIQGVSAVAGWLSESSANEEEYQRRLAALQEYAAISPPEVRQLIGKGVERSAFESVQADQGLQQVQEEAQQRLLERGRNGPSMAYRAEREEAAMQAAARARGNREAVRGEYQQRGGWGSGEELLSTLQGDSDAAQTERLAGVQTLAADEEAALMAMIRAGELAGAREQRDLDTQMTIAGARDDIARFNAGVENQFSLYNDQQRWQQAQFQLDLARSKANAHNGLADTSARHGQANARAIGGLGQAAGYGLNAWGQYQGQQPGQPTRVTSRPATPGEVANPASIGTGAALGGTGQTSAAPRPTTQQYHPGTRRIR